MGGDELAVTVVAWLVGSATTGALLRWDRRRLGPEGRARMWWDTTLYLAVSGLFLPAPLTFGAHLWVTRPGPLWKRLPLSLLGAAGAVALSSLAAELVLVALGVE